MSKLRDSRIGDKSGGGKKEVVVAVTKDVGVRAADVRVRVSERERVGGDDERVAGVEMDAGPCFGGETEGREKWEEDKEEGRESGSHRRGRDRERP